MSSRGVLLLIMGVLLAWAVTLGVGSMIAANLRFDVRRLLIPAGFMSTFLLGWAILLLTWRRRPW